MTYECSKCGEPKPSGEFHESPHKDRTRSVTSWCRECRSETYFKRRYPNSVCNICSRHRHLDKNNTCQKCNAQRGLRECNECREILPTELMFYGRKKVCKQCNPSQRRQTKKEILNEPRLTLEQRGMKLCVHCKEEKSKAAFAAKDICIQCEPAAKRRRQDHHLRTKYGVTLEWYEKTLSGQDGGCAICKTNNPGAGKQYFCVDHDHETQKPRGLLCSRCNQGLGYFKDSVALLMVAVAYLNRFKK